MRGPVIEVYPKGFPSRFRGKDKAKRSDLQDTAKENGVGALFDKSVEVMRTHFRFLNTTVGGLVFSAAMGRRRLVCFSLLPGDSSTHDGLRYNVYAERFAD